MQTQMKLHTYRFSCINFSNLYELKQVANTRLTRGNLSCWQIKVICLTFWYENLTTFPTSDSKLEIAFPIAHSLSYNILTLGRNWSYNNVDTAQRSLPCRFMFGKKCPPIDITRKYEKLCIFAFNRKFDYDDVIKMKLNVICIVENCLSYNIYKFRSNRSRG